MAGPGGRFKRCVQREETSPAFTMHVEEIGSENFDHTLIPTPETGTSAKKKGRGTTRCLWLDKLVKEHGKMKIEFGEAEKPHLLHEGKFSRAISFVVRTRVQLKGVKHWGQIPDSEKDAYALTRLFEIVDPHLPQVTAYIENKFNYHYISWRCSLHKEYKRIKNRGENPKAKSPRCEVNLEDWCSICDDFEDQKFKDRSKTNSNNRLCAPYPHHSGSRSYIDRYREMENPSWIQLFEDVHAKGDQYVNELAESDHARNDANEGRPSMTEKDILEKVRGKTSGYVRGMGHGVEVPRMTHFGSYLNGNQTVKEELSKTKSDLDEANKKTSAQQEQISAQAQHLENLSCQLAVVNQFMIETRQNQSMPHSSW